MKFLIFLLLALPLSTCLALTAEERQGLQNITRWAIEQQAELQSAQTNVIALGNENSALKQESAKKDAMIAWQSGQITNLTTWGNQCEEAVKAIAMALAIALALWVGTAFAGEILKNFPSFEGPVATAILYVVIFLGTYYGVMACIYAIAPYVPTVPVWHDIHAWFDHFHAPKIR
jgi:hypothetical protein